MSPPGDRIITTSLYLSACQIYFKSKWELFALTARVRHFITDVGGEGGGGGGGWGWGGGGGVGGGGSLRRPLVRPSRPQSTGAPAAPCRNRTWRPSVRRRDTRFRDIIVTPVSYSHHTNHNLDVAAIIRKVSNKIT